MYKVNFGTGAGDEDGFETIEVAQKYADDNAVYTQSSIAIEDENGNIVCSRHWWGVGFDSEVDPSENPITFGDMGYYADWE
jgi:hypothetical protein